MSPCLLLVHDSKADAAVVAEVAALLGLTVLHAQPAAESLKLFGTRRPAWVLLCPSAEGGRGATLLAELKRHPYGGRAQFLLLGDRITGSAVDELEPVPLDAGRLAARLRGAADGNSPTQREAIAAAARDAAMKLGAPAADAQRKDGDPGVQAAQQGMRLEAFANSPRSEGESHGGGGQGDVRRTSVTVSPRDPDAPPSRAVLRPSQAGNPRSSAAGTARKDGDSGVHGEQTASRVDGGPSASRGDSAASFPAGAQLPPAAARPDAAPRPSNDVPLQGSSAFSAQVPAGTSPGLGAGASAADVRSRLERASALWERAAFRAVTPARRVPVPGPSVDETPRVRLGESGQPAKAAVREVRRVVAFGQASDGATEVFPGASAGAALQGPLPDGAPVPDAVEAGGPPGVPPPEDGDVPGEGRPVQSPPKPFEIGRLTARVREALLSEAPSASGDVSAPESLPETPAAPASQAAHVVALPPRLEPGAGEEPLEPFARRLCRWASDGRLQQLHLEDDAGRGRWLWLEHGRVVAASSSVAAESLLERARLDGLVTAAELSSLRDLRRAGATEQLAALRGRGWVREDELAPLRSRHLRAVVLEALAAPRIRFERVPADELPGEVPSVAVGVPVLALLVEALRRKSVAATVLERLGGVAARVQPLPHLLPHGALELTPRELSWWEGWEATGGTVEALLLGSGLRDEAAVGLLAALEVLGALEFQPPEQRAPASLGARELARLQAKLQEVARADYFEVLGLPRTAGTGEVLRAWETLRAEFEPLKYVGHPDAGLVRDAQAVCAALDEAVRALRDDRLRAAYARYLVG
jgi:hypothetical protein